MSAEPSPAPALQVLDCAAVSKWLHARGLGVRGTGAPVSPRTIGEWATKGRLPMFKAPTGEYVITEQALNLWLNKQQTQAQRACDERQAPRPARRAGGRR